MSGMSITKARRYRIAFSEPYFRTGQIALVRKQAKTKVPMPGFYGIYSWAPIVTMGVVKGTTGEFFVNKSFNNAKKIVSFATAKEAVTALQKKWIQGYEIDVLIYDAPMVYNIASENEGALVPLPALLTEEYLAWGIRKDDTALLESANKFIEQMKKEGKLMPIIKKWIPVI
jgi:polar amino acid transport system substrate-binding protein